jgi:SAM-dependent methyltransferase
MTESLNYPSEEEALSHWARLVRQNREQAERFREAPERPDFYAPIASVFKSDPRKTGDPVLNILMEMSKPEDTWLDIGAGGGRYTLPLALRVREVTAVEPSSAMREVLSRGIADNNIKNIRILADRWPMKESPQADVALISHVGYDIEDIGGFLEAMETSSRHRCVAVFRDGSPAAPANLFWPLVHGEERVPLPSLREFLVLQIARGHLCEVRLTTQDSPGYASTEVHIAFLRQQLFIQPGGAKDRLLTKLVQEQVKEKDGSLQITGKPGIIGVVSWTPR